MGRIIANPQVREHPHLVRLGEQLRTTRRALGLTMEEVALASGISRVTLHKVEKGKGSVSASALASVAEALGTPLALESEKSHRVIGDLVLGDYPGLASLGWQLAPDTVLAPREMWDFYSRNRRFLDWENLSDKEIALVEQLEKSFGGGSRVSA